MKSDDEDVKYYGIRFLQSSDNNPWPIQRKSHDYVFLPLDWSIFGSNILSRVLLVIIYDLGSE